MYKYRMLSRQPSGKTLPLLFDCINVYERRRRYKHSDGFGFVSLCVGLRYNPEKWA